MSSAYTKLDEIQGFSFGDLIADTACVMTDFHVRANATFKGKEGTRGIMLLAANVVQTLIDGLPEVIEALREEGGDRDLLPPPSRPVPPWDAGPRGKNAKGRDMQMCVGFGVREIAADLGAAVIIINTSGARHKRGKFDSANYLMGWSALLEFQTALPKVMEQLRPHMTSRFYPK